MGRKLPFTLLFSCLILIPLLCGFGTGTGGSGITALPNPDLVTLEVVKELSGGGDDFAGMSARLDAVYQANPAKTDAFFLKSIIDFFAFLRRTAMDPDPKAGVFKNLYSRMGLMNPHDHNGRGNFWNFELVETNHNQGNFPVGAPTLDEAIAFVDGDLRKEIENLIGDLKKIPTGFFYLFQDLSVRDTDFGIILGSDIQGTYSVDYGDVQILVVTLEMFLAQLDLGMAYKWDNLDPNDFDEGDPAFYDPLGQIVNKYKLCGTGRDMNRLAAVIQHMKDAFTAYKNAAGHILNETSQQQSTGIFTIDPAKFKTPQERQDFLNGEKYFRQTWAPGLLNAVATNQGYLVQYAPDGSLLDDPATINFYKFFYDQTGLDLRGTYLKTITNPHNNRTDFGVTDLKNLTADMYTAGGILEKLSGLTPLPGDLQTEDSNFPNYMLRGRFLPHRYGQHHRGRESGGMAEGNQLRSRRHHAIECHGGNRHRRDPGGPGREQPLPGHHQGREGLLRSQPLGLLPCGSAGPEGIGAGLQVHGQSAFPLLPGHTPDGGVPEPHLRLHHQRRGDRHPPGQLHLHPPDGDRILRPRSGPKGLQLRPGPRVAEDPVGVVAGRPPRATPRSMAAPLGGTLARHFFLLFLVPFAWCLLYLQVFLGLCSLLLYLWKFPYLPLSVVVQALPDHVLTTLPLTLSFAMLAGGLFFAGQVRRWGGFLQVALAGRDPRSCQVLLLLWGGLLSLGLLWHNTQVLPVAQYNSRYPAVDPGEIDLSMPLRLLQGQGPLRGVKLRFEKARQGEIAGLLLQGAGKRGATLLAADRAELGLAGEPPTLAATFHRGRLVATDTKGELTENLSFRTLRVDLDARSLLRRAKQDLLHLRYYTNKELDRLERQAALNQSRGLRIGEGQAERLARVPFLKLARIQLALAPLLFIAAIVRFLGVHLERRHRLRELLVVAGCLGLFLPQAMVFVHDPPDLGFASPWAAFLPLAETVFLFGLYAWTNALAGGDR